MAGGSSEVGVGPSDLVVGGQGGVVDSLLVMSSQLVHYCGADVGTFVLSAEPQNLLSVSIR